MIAFESIDPHEVLQIPRGASLGDARNAYLRLVKENPPDQDPERFRQINSAWQSLSDPLVQASNLIRTSDELPSLNQIISDAEKVKPRLPTEFLLSLGNSD